MKDELAQRLVLGLKDAGINFVTYLPETRLSQIVPLIQAEGDISADEKPVTAAQGDEVVLFIGTDPRADRAVIKPGPDLHPEFHVSLDSLDHAQNLPVGLLIILIILLIN